jgi:hypothetical protein
LIAYHMNASHHLLNILHNPQIHDHIYFQTWLIWMLNRKYLTPKKKKKRNISRIDFKNRVILSISKPSLFLFTKKRSLWKKNILKISAFLKIMYLCQSCQGGSTGIQMIYALVFSLH